MARDNRSFVLRAYKPTKAYYVPTISVAHKARQSCTPTANIHTPTTNPPKPVDSQGATLSLNLCVGRRHFDLRGMDRHIKGPRGDAPRSATPPTIDAVPFPVAANSSTAGTGCTGARGMAPASTTPLIPRPLFHPSMITVTFVQPDGSVGCVSVNHGSSAGITPYFCTPGGTGMMPVTMPHGLMLPPPGASGQGVMPHVVLEEPGTTAVPSAMLAQNGYHAPQHPLMG